MTDHQKAELDAIIHIDAARIALFGAFGSARDIPQAGGYLQSIAQALDTLSEARLHIEEASQTRHQAFPPGAGGP